MVESDGEVGVKGYLPVNPLQIRRPAGRFGRGGLSLLTWLKYMSGKLTTSRGRK